MISKIEYKNLVEFIKELYNDAEGISFSTGFDDKVKNKSIKPKNHSLTIKEFLENLTIEKLQEYGENGKYIFARPNLLGLNQRPLQANIKYLNALFVDVDGSQLPPRHLIQPHYVFERQGRFHLYWFIERIEANEKNIEKYKTVSEILRTYYNADQNVKDLLRAMRLPYTPHTKNNSAVTFYATKEKNKINRYSLDKLFETLQKEKTKIYTENLSPSNDIKNEKPKLVNEQIFSDIIYSTYKNKNKKIFVGDGRSKELFFIGINSFSWGLSIDNAVKLADKINQEFFEPPENFEIVKHQIESAYKYHKGEFGENQKNYLTGDEKKQRKVVNQFNQDENLRDFLYRWVYVIDIEQLINLDTGLELRTQKQIENYFTNKTMSIVSFDNILRKKLVTVVDRVNFKPQIADRIYTENNETFLNRFTGVDVSLCEKYDKKAVEIFTNHLRYLTNDDYEFQTMQNYFAYILQNLGKKLPYALLVVSKNEGVGKSILENFFRKILPKNTQAVENTDLDSSFNDYLVDSIFVFVHELAQGDKYHVMNKLKNKITENKIIVNQKYTAKYTIDNAANFVFFSNKIDAIQISSQDRRLFVVYNNKKPMPQSYYDTLYDTLTNNYADIYNYLMQIDLSNFNANERPKKTEGKKILENQSQSELSIFLQNSETERTGAFKYNVVTATSILKFVEMYAPDVIRKKVGIKAVSAWLIENDYIYRHIEKRIGGHRVNRVYYAKNIELINDDEILKTLENAVENTASVI